MAFFRVAQGRFTRGDAKLREAPVEPHERVFRSPGTAARNSSVARHLPKSDATGGNSRLSDGMAMRRAGRTVGRLMVLGASA